MPTGADYQRAMLAKMLMGEKQPAQPGFHFLEDGSLRGVLGGIGREGGGLIGQGLGALFGSGPNNAVNFGGGNQFIPGQGFMQEAFGPPMQGGQMPTAPGFDFGSFFSGLF